MPLPQRSFKKLEHGDGRGDRKDYGADDCAGAELREVEDCGEKGNKDGEEHRQKKEHNELKVFVVPDGGYVAEGAGDAGGKGAEGDEGDEEEVGEGAYAVHGGSIKGVEGMRWQFR